MSDRASDTSIVIPAFNEGPSIAAVVSALRGAASWRELLVVDDGSTDDTAARAEASGARVIRHPYNKGNGAAVKTGIRAATGTFVLILDADGQHRPADALRLVSRLDEYELVELYSGALAIVFPPFDEDYGYVTLEAFLAHKPVVTTCDAGGPLEFVDDGTNGYVVDPTPDAIGGAIAQLAANPQRAAALGASGYDRARTITWDGVVERLMADV